MLGGHDGGMSDVCGGIDGARRVECIVRGAAASRGEYAGRARVVFGDRFDNVEAGAVLVCQRMPSSFVLWRVGALVVDAGGALANAATVARERRVPAVVGTYVGTEVIGDGDYVAVDGTRGIVTVLSRAQDQVPAARAVSGAA